MIRSERYGKFISLEGGEGVGKTTNLSFIKAYLQSKGIELLLTREPGGTALGESVREMLLDVSNKGMHEDTELLLVFAARAQHINQVILPALQQGIWVLSDRFTDASFAYQGGGRGMGFEAILKLEEFVQKGFQPDLTLLLDAEIELGLNRVDKRAKKDRFEEEDNAFFTSVRLGYLKRAAQYPERIKIVNAMQTLAQVQTEIVKNLDELINAT